MVVYWSILLLLNGVIPTKWLRIGGIPFGDAVTAVVYAIFTARAALRPSPASRGFLAKSWLICVVVVVLAALHAWIEQPDGHQTWLENSKQAMHYLATFLAVGTITTLRRYRRVLQAFFLTGLCAAALLFLFSVRIDLVSPEVGTGMINRVDGQDRVFTAGMQYVFICAVALIPYIHRARGPKLVALAAAWLFLCTSLVFTSVRSFYVIIAVAICLTLGRMVINGEARAALRVTTVLTAAGLAAVTFAPGDMLSTFAGRMETLSGLRQESIQEFDTLGWRVLDAGNAIAAVETPSEKLLGAYAKPYATAGLYTAMPHIAYAGIYYHFGSVGIVTFTLFGIALAVGLVRLSGQRKVLSELGLACEYDAIILVALALALYSFIGGTFITGSNIIAIVLIWHGLSLLARLFPKPVSRIRKAQNTVPLRSLLQRKFRLSQTA